MCLHYLLPLLLRRLLLAVFVLHLDEQCAVATTRDKADQVGDTGPDSKALSDCALNWVTVRPVVFVRDMEKQAAILREGVVKPNKTRRLYFTLVAFMASLLRLFLRFYYHSLS